MAEALGKHLYPHHGWRSRGLAVRADSVTAEHIGFTLGDAVSHVANHAATSVEPEDVDWADVVYAMTAQQVQELERRFGTPAGRLDERGDISDPHGGDVAVYRHSYDHIRRAMLMRFGTP